MFFSPNTGTMLGIFSTLFTFVLILVSLFMMLVVLMQRANTNAGMGAAFGGGVADSAFGADTTNVLTRATKWSAVAFFVLSAALYLTYIAQSSSAAAEEEALTDIPVEVDTAAEEASPAAANPSVSPTERALQEEVQGTEAVTETAPTANEEE